MANSVQNFIRIPCIVKRCTPKAVLVQRESGDMMWVPRSVSLDGADIHINDEDISIDEWWLKKNEVDY